MRAEYDFSKGVRGIYAKRFSEGAISYCWILMWPVYFPTRKR
jgi:hypothetical protein